MTIEIYTEFLQFSVYGIFNFKSVLNIKELLKSKKKMLVLILVSMGQLRAQFPMLTNNQVSAPNPDHSHEPSISMM